MEGQRGYPPGGETSWFGVEEENEQRVPGPRSAGWGGPPGPGPVGPRSGQALPPLPVDQLGGPPGLGADEQSRHIEAIERTALRRHQSASLTGDGIYRTRRPVIAVPLGIGAALLAVPAVRVLLSSAFGPVIVPAGVISSMMALIGLPLLAMGLYALMTGAARMPDPSWARVWLRPPLVYLVIGLVCCLAAGLAVR